MTIEVKEIEGTFLGWIWSQNRITWVILLSLTHLAKRVINLNKALLGHFSCKGILAKNKKTEIND